MGLEDHDGEKKYSEQEALDGELGYSDTYEMDAAKTTAATMRSRERIRYQGAVAVAITVATAGAAIELSITKLARWKFNTVEILTRHENYITACAILCSLSAVFGLIAGAMVILVAPRAKGSGIPEIKTYLNGIRIRRVISERTLVAKFVGIIFSVAGGLLCGKEGPMVHIGAIVGAIVAQGRGETVGRRTGARPRAEAYKFLNCDLEKTEFVALGCACGVTSAFGSPIGGVLFMIEEALSFWNQRLFFRATFASTVNIVGIVLLLSKLRTRHGHFTKLKFEGMAAFDDFSHSQPPAP